MVAEQRTAVDVEGAVRQWCRDEGFLTFFGHAEPAGYPQVNLFQVREFDFAALIQFNVWGDKSQGKKAARTESDRLVTALTGLTSYDYEGVRLHGARVDNGGQWLPDDVSDQPRYIVEATVFATATS